MTRIRAVWPSIDLPGARPDATIEPSPTADVIGATPVMPPDWQPPPTRERRAAHGAAVVLIGIGIAYGFALAAGLGWLLGLY